MIIFGGGFPLVIFCASLDVELFGAKISWQFFSFVREMMDFILIYPLGDLLMYFRLSCNFSLNSNFQQGGWGVHTRARTHKLITYLNF